MDILERLACNGISKARGSDDAMTVYFNRPLTDDEIEFFNNCILRWARFAPIQHMESKAQLPAKPVNRLLVRAH
ncbi:MAG: hypothetical protein AAGI06_14185 [Pseudomonadota bacterium]